MTLDDRLAQSEQRYTEAELKNKKLESTLEEYRNAREQYDKELRSKTAGQNATIDQLQEEISILKGKLEETDYLLKQKINAFAELSEKSEIKLTSIDKTANLNKDRIERLEQYLNFESEHLFKKGSRFQIKHLQNKSNINFQTMIYTSLQNRHMIKVILTPPEKDSKNY